MNARIAIKPCNAEFSGLNPCISALRYTNYTNNSRTPNWHIIAYVCLGGCIRQAENAEAENAESLSYFRCGREIKFLN